MKKIVFCVLVTGIFFNLSAQYSEENHFLLIQSDYEQLNLADTTALLNEMEIFLARYPKSVYNAEMLSMMSGLAVSKNDSTHAILHLTKICFLYPEYENSQSIIDRIQKMLAGNADPKFNQIAGAFSEGLEHISPGFKFNRMYFEYFNYIRQFDAFLSEVALQSEFDFFIRNYFSGAPTDAKILIWAGRLLQDRDFAAHAHLLYKKVLLYYPGSADYVEALFRDGLIFYESFNQPARAREYFIQIITEYNESPFAGFAQFYLAELDESSLQNPDEAISDYQVFIDNFADNQLIPQAHQRLARLYYTKKMYEESAAQHFLLLETAADSILRTASYLALGEIFIKDLQVYDKAAENWVAYCANYPENPDAAQRLFEAAEIYRSKIKQPQKARELFKQLIENYPQSPFKSKAAKAIKSLK